MTNLEAARNLAANFPTMWLLLLGLLLKLFLRKRSRNHAGIMTNLEAARNLAANFPTMWLLLLGMEEPLEGVEQPVEGVTHMCRLVLLSRDMDCLTSPHLTSPHYTPP